MSTADFPSSSSQIAIAATFVAEPVEQSLSFWLRELDIPQPITFAPYNQVFQQLLDPASLFGANPGGINVVLARVEDWQRDQPDSVSLSDARCIIERDAHDLVRALIAAATRSAAIHLLFLCPARPQVAVNSEQAAFFEQTERLIVAELSAVPNVHVVTSATLAATYPVAGYYDTQTDKLAHIPYTTLFFTALGSAIARTIHALRNTHYKAIVLDCDQTLWDGICGEDGPRGIQIGAARTAIQKFMVEQHDAGMLLCLCSQNNEEDVAEVFMQRTEMPLRREHFAGWRVNWRPKSENIQALAAQLQLGLDSIIFIDDDDVVCAEVQAHCPQVLTLQLPRQPDMIPGFLRHLWAFDRLTVTTEASERTVLYKRQVQREQSREESPSLRDFIENLDLRIEISPLAAEQMARVSELTQRTNQFNLTTIRRTVAEIQMLYRSSGLECLTVRLTDRFGEYGLVGVMIFELGPDALKVDTFLLSCRALGRGVEYRMLAAIGEAAEQCGLDWVDVAFSQTRKNQPGLDFLKYVAADFEALQTDGSLFFRLPAKFAAALSFNPRSEEVIGGKVGQAPIGVLLSTTPVASARARAALLRAIALELCDAEQIQKAISADARRRPELATIFVAPRSTTEQKLAEIWSELLDVDRIGVDDNFFELGGHSLFAIQLLSRIRDTFQVELSLRSLFTDQFTVSDMAKSVLEQQIQGADARNIAVLLQKINELSDDEVKALLALDANRVRDQQG